MSLAFRIKLALGADITADEASWTWTDFSSRARHDLTYRYGRVDEADETTPGEVRLSLGNNDGWLTPYNPASPWFPYVRRQTPVSVEFNPGTGYAAVFLGYIDEITPIWPAGNAGNCEVAIVASGSMRRLQQHADPAQSATYRAQIRQGAVAYWPLEGGIGQTLMYDAISSAPTENVDQSAAVAGQAGAARFGTAALGDGSDQVANIAGSWTLGMKAPTGVAATGECAFQWSVNFGTEVRTGGFVNVGMRLNPAVASTHLTWQFYVQDDGTGHIDVYEADPLLTATAGPTTVSTFTVSNLFSGLPRNFQLDLRDGGGANVDFTLWIDGAIEDFGTYTASFSGAMNAPPYRLSTFTFSIPASATVAFGHAAIFTAIPVGAPAAAAALNGYAGEIATDRLQRLADEESIKLSLVGASDIAMGPQRTNTFLASARECEAADGGILYDGAVAGLSYLARPSRYNQAAAMALNVVLGQVKLPFNPTEDDQRVINDQTVNLPVGGLPVQVVDQAHIDAHGRYRASDTVNVAAFSALRDQASWRVHLGTVAEMRVAQLALELIDRPELWSAALGLRPGDRVTVTNLMSQYPPGTLDVICEGISVVASAVSWRLTVNCSPASPWTVGLLGTLGADGFLDCGGSTANEVLDTTETGVDVKITDLCAWTHADGDYKVRIDGEEMTVTGVGAVTGTYPNRFQTLTVVRSTNGVVATHAIGAEVHVVDGFLSAL